MSTTSFTYYPRYGYLVFNVLFTALFFWGAYYLISLPLYVRYDGSLDPMGLMLIAVCLIVPIIINLSTVPQYRVYGVDDQFFRINGKKYEWKRVSLEGYETLEKRLTLVHALTVARRVEENLKIVILDTEQTRVLRRLRINNKICSKYYDLEYEIREHLTKA